jgi:hypothetical protein
MDLPHNAAIFIIKVSLNPVALYACTMPLFYVEPEYEPILFPEMMTLATCKSQRSFTQPALTHMRPAQ